MPKIVKPVTNSTRNQRSLSDHSFVCCFWILSVLATKGIKKVICKFCRLHILFCPLHWCPTQKFEVIGTPCPTKVGKNKILPDSESRTKAYFTEPKIFSFFRISQLFLTTGALSRSSISVKKYNSQKIALMK